MTTMKKGNPWALLPIGVFLILYLGLGLLLEYGLKIPMGFYNVPIVAAFMVAILTACLQNRSTSFEEKLTIMGQGVGDKNIITMLLIFLEAGAFVGIVGRSSAASVAYFMLDVIPPQFAVAVLFVGMFVFTIGEVVTVLGSNPYNSRRIPASHRGRIGGISSVIHSLFSSLTQYLISGILFLSGSNYRLIWTVFICCGLMAAGLYTTMYGPDKRTFPKLYEKQK